MRVVINERKKKSQVRLRDYKIFRREKCIFKRKTSSPKVMNNYTIKRMQPSKSKNKNIGGKKRNYLKHLIRRFLMLF